MLTLYFNLKTIQKRTYKLGYRDFRANSVAANMKQKKGEQGDSTLETREKTEEQFWTTATVTCTTQ
jgi:hypothetical protein